jgi:hypothetical protein
MTDDKLDRWLRVIGNLAIIIGLVVVAVELRQTSTIANGELSIIYMTNWQALDRSRQDPSFAAVYVKSMEQPDELTLAEKVQLDGYYWVMAGQWEIARQLTESGLFNMTYEEILRLDVRILLTTPYAQAWWRWYRDEFADPVMASIVDDELERISPQTAREWLDAVNPGAVESEPEE